MSIKNEHKMLETPYTRDRVLLAFVMRASNITPTLREIAYNCDTLRFLVGVVYPYLSALALLCGLKSP